MSIQDIRQKINTYIEWTKVFWVATIFGLVVLGVGLLALNMNTHFAEGITITSFEGPVFKDTVQIIKFSSVGKDTVYASKNGTKYYYEDCSGLKRIKAENKVSFASAALAEQAGYSKAANCH